jgi:hypothetical protein
MLRKDSSMPMTAAKPLNVSLPLDKCVALLEGLCHTLQQRLKDHEDLIESVFKPDGSIELRSAHKLDIVVGSSRISIDASGIRVQSALNVRVDVTRFEVNAGQMSANVGLFNAAGMIRCQTIQADTVIGASYTPGAGNLV